VEIEPVKTIVHFRHAHHCYAEPLQ